MSGMAVWLAVLCLCHVVAAHETMAQTTETLTIGYVEIADDARYAPIRGAEHMVLATRDRPYPAVEVALDEAKPLSTVIHRDFRCRANHGEHRGRCCAGGSGCVAGAQHPFLRA